MARAASTICSDSSRATRARRCASSCAFGANRCGDLIHDIAHVLLLFAEKRIEESGIADVMPQFAMLEEDVHGFPERVIENLDQFLMDEWILDRRLERVGTARPGSAKVMAPRLCATASASATSASPSGGPKPMTMSSG